MIDFKDKNILITGASSGIGAAMSRCIASMGGRLFLAARSVDKLEDVRKECIALGANAETFCVDMASMDSIDAFVRTVQERRLLFDVIVLNAGISQRALTLETDFEVDRKVMETNFFGPVYLTKKLRDQLVGRPLSLAVTTSISGLFGFFESLEAENPNVRVTFLIPGRINTPISKSAVLKDGSSYAKMDKGQANGMDVDKCARIAVRAIARRKHRKLIGGFELTMVYIKKWCPWLYYKLAGRISAT